jgi:hypothetical protein
MALLLVNRFMNSECSSPMDSGNGVNDSSYSALGMEISEWIQNFDYNMEERL